MAAENISLHTQPKVKSLIKVGVFIGIYLVRIFDSTTWLWGNLSVYVTAYYYAIGDTSSAKQTNWLLTVNLTAYNIGVLIGGFINKRFGLMQTLFVVTILYNAFTFLSYFALKQSAIMLTVVYGVIPGISGGISDSCRWSLAVNWTKKYFGLAASSVPSSNVLASVVMNLVVTLFINPNNQQTSSEVDGVAIFTQKEIIDRVPYVFLILGTICTLAHSIGFILLREHPGTANSFTEMYMMIKYKLEKCSGEKRLLDKDIGVHQSVKGNEGNGATPVNQEDKEIQTISSTYGISKIGRDRKSLSIADVTPLDVLKRREFYTLVVCNACQTYGVFVINTYYKSFGLLYIPDDHFLTYVVMVKLLMTPMAAWFAGFCIDKVGIKLTLVVASSLYTTIASFIYLTIVNKWLYLIACVLYACFLFSTFCITCACCVRLFGKTHFTSILGMALISTYILTFVQPPLSEWIVSNSGYYPLFISSASLGFVHMLICIWGLPEVVEEPASLVANTNRL